MITLTAKINLLSSNDDTLRSVTINGSKSNISSDIGKILGYKSQGSNPFILGASKLGDGSTLSDKVDYFIGSVPSEENPCILTISGTNITSFTIEFDKVNNRHPNTIMIDDGEYADDDAIFTLTLPTEESTEVTHTIKIDNWNTPSYPLVIMGIYVDIVIDIDYTRLIGVERSIIDRNDMEVPSYGVISNSGRIEFNDTNGEIKDYAENLLLTSDLNVTISLNNTLLKNGKEEVVGIFKTETWDYDNDNRSVSVSLKDELEEWQEIQVLGFSYNPRNPYMVLKNGSMEDLYKWLWDKTPSKYNMLSYDELDETTKEILSKTIIKYPFLKDDSLWRQWTKLCEVCALYIYKNNDNKTVCSYTYGS